MNWTQPTISEERDAAGRPGVYVVYRKQCSECKKTYEVAAAKPKWLAWKRGQFIQEAMPELSADQREFLVSGATPCEFEKLFPADEE